MIKIFTFEFSHIEGIIENREERMTRESWPTWPPGESAEKCILNVKVQMSVNELLQLTHGNTANAIQFKVMIVLPWNIET